MIFLPRSFNCSDLRMERRKLSRQERSKCGCLCFIFPHYAKAAANQFLSQHFFFLSGQTVSMEPFQYTDAQIRIKDTYLWPACVFLSIFFIAMLQHLSSHFISVLQLFILPPLKETLNQGHWSVQKQTMQRCKRVQPAYKNKLHFIIEEDGRHQTILTLEPPPLIEGPRTWRKPEARCGGELIQSVPTVGCVNPAEARRRLLGPSHEDKTQRRLCSDHPVGSSGSPTHWFVTGVWPKLWPASGAEVTRQFCLLRSESEGHKSPTRAFGVVGL